jgi:DNA-binding NtrC family response regulator
LGLKVLVVEDDAELRRAIERHLKRHGAEVAGTESVAVAVETLSGRQRFDAVLLDMWLPDGRGLDVLDQIPKGLARPATIVMTGEATVETAVGALRVGAIDYLLKPFSMDALDAALARVVTKQSGTFDVATTDTSAIEEWRRRHAPTMLGRHPTLLRAFQVLARIAPTDCSVLVQGETGTGKELVARAIHGASGRGAQPFVAVNCAAVPEQLMESELFGHGKGAFTGAERARTGRFQMAHKGTLFLDEVGEMPLAVQAKLLRALQEKEILPLGETKPVEVDVRVVAATHRDLEQMVEKKLFREDLLYRLDVIRVELPSLRQRREDIPLLVEAFIADTSRRRGCNISGIDVAAMQALMAYHWPGNVRQLQNAIERMVLLRGDGTLTIDDVPDKMRESRKAEEAASLGLASPLLPTDGVDLRDAVERYEGGLIRQALERTGWNKNRAAALLKLNRTTLVEKLKKRGWLTEDETPDGAPTSRDPQTPD